MKRTAQAKWSGALKDGTGALSMQSGAFDNQPYSFKTRFEDESGKAGTNPEELIAAAHAGCFAMQLSHFLAEAGHPAKELKVDAEVTVDRVDGAMKITKSALTLNGDVPGMDEATFMEQANKAKEGCPVSKALGAIEITLDATLAS